MKTKCLDPMRECHSTRMAGLLADGQTVCILVKELNNGAGHAVGVTTVELSRTRLEQ
jgi:hypothetical protein